MTPAQAEILIAEPDPTVAAAMSELLRKDGIVVQCAHDTAGLESGLRGHPPDALILDANLTGSLGTDLLERIRREHAEVSILVTSAAPTVAAAVACMQAGALDFLPKPIDELRLVTAVRHARERAAMRSSIFGATAVARAAVGVSSLVGVSEAAERCRELLMRAAETDLPVLLLGETGVGKRTAARALHAESQRAAGPFVVVDCSAHTPDALVKILFGTGDQPGAVERATQGTLLLLDAQQLPPAAQPPLQRLLADGVSFRDGSITERRTDVRVIAAAAEDPRNAGMLPELYYRLATFCIPLPPLRDRAEDILPLAKRIAEAHATRAGHAVPTFTATAREALREWTWPGNLRELGNVIAHATLAGRGATIDLANLSDDIVVEFMEPKSSGPRHGKDHDDGEILPLEVEERRVITRALDITGWNIVATAQRLGIGRATLYRRMHGWGMHRPGTAAEQ